MTRLLSVGMAQAFATVFLLCCGNFAAAQGQWWDDTARQNATRVGRAIHEQGYSCYMSLGCQGNVGIGIGQKLIGGKLAVSRDTFLKVDLSKGTVREVVPMAELEKYFPEHTAPSSNSSFALNAQGNLLAIGRYRLPTGGDAESAILLVDISNGSIRVLVDNGALNRSYRFSPDGRYLLFSNHLAGDALRAEALGKVHSYSMCVVEVETGKVSVLKPRPAAKAFFYYQIPTAWSPDSQTVAFQWLDPDNADRNSRLQLVACTIKDMRCRTLLSDYSGYSDLFFVDAERFVACRGRKLYLVDTRTDSVRTLVSWEGKYAITNPRPVGDVIRYRTGPDDSLTMHEVAIPAR